jgi:hypothetical protein
VQPLSRSGRPPQSPSGPGEIPGRPSLIKYHPRRKHPPGAPPWTGESMWPPPSTAGIRAGASGRVGAAHADPLLRPVDGDRDPARPAGLGAAPALRLGDRRRRGVLATSPAPAGYARSFFGIVDLLAIAPFTLGLVFVGFGLDLRAVRALRLLRLVRLLKLARTTSAIDRLLSAWRAVKEEVAVFGVAAVIVLYVCALVIDQFEHDAQPARPSANATGAAV